MRSYEAARGLFSFLAICSWAIIIVGGLVALAAGTALSSGLSGNPSAMKLFLAFMPGAGISLVGLYGLRWSKWHELVSIVPSTDNKLWEWPASNSKSRERPLAKANSSLPHTLR